MPAINKKQILDDSVKKAFEELNASIKITVDQLTLLTKQGLEMQAALKGQNINQLADAQTNYNVVNNTAIADQKALIDLEIKRNQLLKAEQDAILAKTKAEKLSTDETKKSQREAEKQLKTSAQLTSAYAQESKKLTDLRNRAKDAAIQYGVNSKEAKELASQVGVLDKKLKAVDSSLGQNQRNVGNYSSAMGGLKNVLGSLGLAFGGVELAQMAFNKTLESSQAAGDSWAVTMGGINGAMTKFFSMIGTGNFSNFIENLKTASEAGRELAKAMDDMFERDLSVDLAESQANLEISIQEKIRNDVNKTKEERISAAQAIDDIETRLAAKKQNREGKAYEAFAGYLESQTKLTRAQLIEFISNFDELKTVEDAINAKREDAKKQTRGKFQGGGAAQQEAAATAAILEKTLTDSEKIFIEFRRKYQGASDEMIKDVVDSYKKIIDVETEKNDRTLRNTTKMNNFIKSLNEDVVKDVVASEAKKEASVKATIETILDLQDEIPVTTKEVTDEVERELTKREQSELDAIIKVRDARRADFEDHIELEKQKTQILKDLQREALDQGLELVTEVGNAIFETKNEQLADETEAIMAEYDKRLANETLSEEQRSQLEAQREAKKNALERKKREIERKQFLFQQGMKLADIAMNTAVAVMKNTAQLGAVLAIPVNALTIAMGVASAAIVAAQTIPKFDKGSDSTPSTFWAGEKRPEIMINNGRAQLVDKPTLFDGDQYKGSQIISGADTARMLQDETFRSIMGSGRVKKGDDLQVLMALKSIDKSIKSSRSTTSVNVLADVKTSKWYKQIRN